MLLLSAALVLTVTVPIGLAHFNNGWHDGHDPKLNPANYTTYKYSNYVNAFDKQYVKNVAYTHDHAHSHNVSHPDTHTKIKVKKVVKTKQYSHYHDGRYHKHNYDEVHYEPVKVKKKKYNALPKHDYSWKAYTDNHAHTALAQPVVVTQPTYNHHTVPGIVNYTTKPVVVKPVTVKKHYYPKYKYYDHHYNYNYVYHKPVVEKVYHQPLVKYVQYDYVYPKAKYSNHYSSPYYYYY